jgi:hypothetical protein
MNFEQNFGYLLAMAGFTPTAEFYQGSTQMQVRGAYLNLPGSEPIQTLNVAIASPLEGSLVNGIVEISATTFGTVEATQVEFFVNRTSIGTDTNGSDGWSFEWNTTAYADGVYELTAIASGGTLTATSAVRTVTVANDLAVQIVEPANNSTVTGAINLVAHTAGLNPATGVSFSYAGDGDPVTIGEANENETSPGVWELTWDTSAIPAGDYLLTATATNGTETAVDTIAVEIVTLSVTIVAPDDGAFLSGVVELQAEVISAAPVSSVEFFYDADEWPEEPQDVKVSLGEATFDEDRGLWVLDWDTTEVADTPLTKPRTEDELSVVVTVGTAPDTTTAGDAIMVRVGNMLTARIFLPDNQENLLGYEDLEAFVASQYDITSVRFDLYDIGDIDPNILIPFGQASPDGQRILDYKYGRPLGNPEYPTGSPVYAIGEAVSEGSSRYVIRNWDTKTIPDGTYGLVATAFDSGGRKATYMVETYIVNDLRVVISAPAMGQPSAASSPGGAHQRPVPGDQRDIQRWRCGHPGQRGHAGRWKAVWDANSSADGPYTIMATATNIAAEVATHSVGDAGQPAAGRPPGGFLPLRLEQLHVVPMLLPRRQQRWADVMAVELWRWEHLDRSEPNPYL